MEQKEKKGTKKLSSLDNTTTDVVVNADLSKEIPTSQNNQGASRAKGVQKYELVVIIRPTVPENVRMGIESKILENLEKESAKVDKVENWGRKKLEYKIQNFQEGFYILYNFSVEKDKLEEIDKNLKLNKDIIRYLIISI